MTTAVIFAVFIVGFIVGALTAVLFWLAWED
jgi:hypothetical protein